MKIPKIKAIIISKPGFYIKIYTRSHIKTDMKTSTRHLPGKLLELGPTFRTNNIQEHLPGPIPGNLLGPGQTFIPIILQGHLLQDMHKSHEYKSPNTGSEKNKMLRKSR